MRKGCEAAELGRRAYGFEVDKNFYRAAMDKMLNVKLSGDEQVLLCGDG